MTEHVPQYITISHEQIRTGYLELNGIIATWERYHIVKELPNGEAIAVNPHSQKRFTVRNASEIPPETAPPERER